MKERCVGVSTNIVRLRVGVIIPGVTHLTDCALRSGSLEATLNDTMLFNTVISVRSLLQSLLSFTVNSAITSRIFTRHYIVHK
jgi:hypothetical protein